MKVNENAALISDKIVLVPYRPEHVPKYHEWMTDPEMLRLTASEPLSLEQEYEMQRSWHHDDDKLTFIVLGKTTTPAPGGPKSEWIKSLPMIGDVNMFFNRSDGNLEIECEVMIADSDYRGKGYGYNAMLAFLSYASSSPPAGLGYPRDAFIAKIGTSNLASIRLFERLGFKKTKVVEVFQEAEMRYSDGEWTAEWSLASYDG